MSPLKPRMRIFEAINNSSIHQSLSTASSQVAIQRRQANVLMDSSQTIETLRSVIQPEINKRIYRVISEFCDSHFKPAIQNMKVNLGEENVSLGLLDDVCISVLENAKEMYNMRSEGKKASPGKGKSPNHTTLKRSSSSSSISGMSPIKKSLAIKSGMGRPNTELVLVNKSGRPVRREGPKWDQDRINADTVFILGSRANKALGFGQTRGRLYMKHPELFKYSGDQTDKEWLANANLISTTGGKAFLMVLQDIVELTESPEYSAHPKLQPGELVGFTVPDWMIEKMKAYMETARTNPDTSDEELLRMAEEFGQMEDEGKRRRDDDEIDDSRQLPEDNGHQQQSIPLYKLMGDSGRSSRVSDMLLDNIKQENSREDMDQLNDRVKCEMDELDVKPKLQAGETDGLETGSGGSEQPANRDEELSLDKLMGESETAPNVAQLLQDMKHEHVDDDLQNLDPGFLQGMNLHNLVRELEMETGAGSELNLLALTDDALGSLH